MKKNEEKKQKEIALKEGNSSISKSHESSPHNFSRTALLISVFSTIGVFTAAAIAPTIGWAAVLIIGGLVGGTGLGVVTGLSLDNKDAEKGKNKLDESSAVKNSGVTANQLKHTKSLSDKKIQKTFKQAKDEKPQASLKNGSNNNIITNKLKK